MNICHLILTRFNCRFAASWKLRALEPQWLSDRFDLFERYCLPSMKAQTWQRFRWLLLFDEETPSPFRERSESYAAHNIEPIWVGNVTPELVDQIIRERIAPGATHVMTTRLDNDDTFSIDAMARLATAARATSARRYLNFPTGYVLSRGRLYRHYHQANAFVSLIEPVDGTIDNVWKIPHTEIASHAPVVQIDDSPAWLQVVHGDNVSNRVRGTRVLPATIASKFVIDQNTLQHERGLDYLWDRLAMSNVWAGRDLLRTAARHTRTRLAG